MVRARLACGPVTAAQHRNSVKEPIDCAGLKAHDKIHLAATHLHLGDIAFSISQWVEFSVKSAAVKITGLSRVAAVAAVTGNFTGIIAVLIPYKDRDSLAPLVVDDGLLSSNVIVAAVKGIDERTGKQRCYRTDVTDRNRE